MTRKNSRVGSNVSSSRRGHVVDTVNPTTSNDAFVSGWVDALGHLGALAGMAQNPDFFVLVIPLPEEHGLGDIWPGYASSTRHCCANVRIA